MSELSEIPFNAAAEPRTSYGKITELQHGIGKKDLTASVFLYETRKPHAVAGIELCTHMIIFHHNGTDFDFPPLAGIQVLPFIREESVTRLVSVSLLLFLQQE